MLLFYVRHGDPIYDPDSLTPLGLKQADALAKRLCRYGIDEIYSSSSNRAVLTGTPTAELLKKEIHKVDWCHEGKAWEYTAMPNGRGGRSWPVACADNVRLFMRPDVMALGEKWYTHPDVMALHDFTPGLAAINRDVDAFLASLGYEHDRENHVYIPTAPNDKRIALFAHYGAGMCVLSSLLDIPYNIFCSHFNLSTSGMTVIKFEERDGFVVPEVLTLSNDSHVYAEGLPTKYNGAYYF